MLWVALIGGIVLRFHKPIEGILSALQKRLDEGSDLKVGPVELTGQLRAQDPKAAQEKVAEEVHEVLQITAGSLVIGSDSDPPDSRAHTAGQVQSRYLQTEDLVLRALQAEYGAPVSRQVTAGADRGFDGAFVSNGRLNIVEVKYVRSLRQLDSYRASINRIASNIARYEWRNAQIILAVVFEQTDDVGPGAARLEAVASEFSVPVIVRAYSLTELETRFRVGEVE
jgi:hypothetical protein